MPITIADVAARAKVSKTTVSRGLNGKGELNESTAARVRKFIEEVGYVPSSRPVDLARGRTRVVGMLAPPLTWSWIGEVVQDAVDVLETERSMSLCSKTVLKSSPASNAAALFEAARDRAVARDGRGRGTHAARPLRGPLPNRPPSYRQRSRSAPPPRVHNRHRTALSRAPLSPDFRNT